MEGASPFVPLLLITLLAVVVPVVFNRLRPVRLPVVVGEILAGVVIGKSGFDLVGPHASLDFLAEFGFVFLMFLSGLEVNVTALVAPGDTSEARPRWQRPIPLALIIFGLTLLLAVISGILLVTLGLARDAILMGLILSTTSLGIVVPVLKERGVTANTYGQTLLIIALLSDFVTLLLLSLDVAILSRGLTLEILLFSLMLTLFAVAARFGQLTSRTPGLQRIWNELSQATAQIPVRGAFALMIAWVVLAEGLGLEIILGAFFAGAIISLSQSRPDEAMHDKLDAIGYGFFIPIFFIMVGANFDLGALLESPQALILVPLLIVAAYLVKIVPTLLLRVLFGWRETLAAGVLLSSRLSLIIAASAIALNLGLITDATNAAIILVAIVSCTFSPILFNRILPQPENVERRGVIILGTNQMAQLLGERLRRGQEPVTFIGRDRVQLTALQQRFFRVIEGDPTDPDVLESACASRSRALMMLSTTFEHGLTVCRIARDQFRVPTIIARVDDPDAMRGYQDLGVQVIQPLMATVLALEGALLFPSAFDMLQERTDGVELLDVPLQNRSFDGRSLRNLRLPGNALILGVRRGGEIIVPHGNTVLRQGDTLMLVGSTDALLQTRHWVSLEPEILAASYAGSQSDR